MERATPVLSLAAVIRAPATTAPVASAVVPTMVPETIWERAVPHRQAKSSSDKTACLISGERWYCLYQAAGTPVNQFVSQSSRSNFTASTTMRPPARLVCSTWSGSSNTPNSFHFPVFFVWSIWKAWSPRRVFTV